MVNLKNRATRCEVFILAGGLSARMGRDKSRVRLGPQTMLEHVRAAAARTGLPVRVIRRDAVPRCGPLGGIYTALKRSRAEMVLFLACDMPFVPSELLERMVNAFGRDGALRSTLRKDGAARRPCQFATALFASKNGRAGFPFLLRREFALPVVTKQIQAGEYSLQSLAKKLRAKTLRFSAGQLANINTPAELKKAERLFRS
ncbi:MAG TPA: molybdenum cofactor guanylyltransferase [Verrucomicrobiae bacterium]|nr:molybdenum cofactor guanylyltransferase [Verrucomicrobiae bacterium]